jgi:hypothetical protein
MNHEILPFVLAAIPAFLWIYLSTRLLLRPQGGRIPWNPTKSPRKKLAGMPDHLALGVLGFGGAMFIFDWVDRYIRSKLYGNQSDQLHFEALIQLFSALFGGLVFGLLLGFLDSILGRKRVMKS